MKGKNMKRIISVVLTLTLLFTTLVFTSVESVAADGITSRIYALRSKFPHGKYWNHYTNNYHNHNGAYGSCTNGNCNNPNGYTASPCSSHEGMVGVGGIDCNNFDGAIQCMGFAYKLFYDVFGVYASQTANRYDTANVAVGDYVRILGDTHSAFVIGRSGDTITVAECNLDGSGAYYNCYIRWDKTYPVSSINYFKHASNYDSVNGSATHTCNHGTFLYFWAAHPHYNCYACSICGQEVVDRNSSNYWDKCTECTNPHTHISGAWTVIKAPTYFENGEELQSCTGCGEELNRRTVPMLTYTNKFTDVKDNAWYADAVASVVKCGYMNGMSETKFSPNTNITREQFVLILANIAGVDTNQYKNTDSGFADVKTGQWYSGAVTWAVREGYVSGMSAVAFGRGLPLQRAALARMLFNYASKNGINTSGRADLSSFGDAAEFVKPGNSWMLEPVQWAVKSGIISGMTVNGKNCVNPKGTATRAQTARMLMVFDSLTK